MNQPVYVEEHDGGYWVAGTRVSLDSVVIAFLNGQSPESIARSFPVLRLEQVYGAITFYLANRSQVDTYLERAARAYEQQYRESRQAEPEVYDKLERLLDQPRHQRAG